MQKPLEQNFLFITILSVIVRTHTIYLYIAFFIVTETENMFHTWEDILLRLLFDVVIRYA